MSADTRYRAPTTSPRLETLDVLSIGMSLDVFRQGQTWQTLQEQSAKQPEALHVGSILPMDPKKYPITGDDKDMAWEKRKSDALELGLRDFPEKWAIPSITVVRDWNPNTQNLRFTPERTQKMLTNMVNSYRTDAGLHWHRIRNIQDEKMLSQAKKFHTDLSDYYHPNSYVHYGADDSHQAFHRVTWRIGIPPTLGGRPSLVPPPTRDHAFSLQLTGDSYEGRVWMVNEMNEQQWVNQNGVGVTRSTLGDSYFADLQGQDQAGDGTVPAHAAEDAGPKAVFAARMTGYDHQGSYKNSNVQHITLYSILRIAAAAKELSA